MSNNNNTNESLHEHRQEASAHTSINERAYNRQVLNMYGPGYEQRPFHSPTRKNVEKNYPLCTSASIRLEKIKRQGRWINNTWVPGGNYGYRITKELPGNHAYTLDQLREIYYNLGEFLKNEQP